MLKEINPRIDWKRWLPAHSAPAWAVVVLIVSYALFFSAFTLAQHRAFLTLGFDLGNVDQALWSTTQGRILRYTNWPGGTIRFGNHFEPILLLVSLTYFIHSGPETLLVLQSVVLAWGAWPIFRLAGRRLESEWMGVLFAALYLLFPGLEAANVFDFHAVALAPTCLAWAFWSLEQARYRRFVVWGLLAMACKEEIPLIVALMGVWLVVRGRRRLGMATIGLGVTWTAVALLVIIPGLNTLDVSPHLSRYSQLGQGPQQMLVNLVTRPHLYVETLTAPLKTRYLVKLFFPTGYLALLAPHVLLLAAPSFAVNLLSSRPHMVALEKFHYTAPLAPFDHCRGLRAGLGGAWIGPDLSARGPALYPGRFGQLRAAVQPVLSSFQRSDAVGPQLYLAQDRRARAHRTPVDRADSPACVRIGPEPVESPPHTAAQGIRLSADRGRRIRAGGRDGLSLRRTGRNV